MSSGGSNAEAIVTGNGAMVDSRRSVEIVCATEFRCARDAAEGCEKKHRGYIDCGIGA